MRKPTEHYFYAQIENYALELLQLKRDLFDAGYQQEHGRVAEAEAELHKALAILNDRIKGPRP